MNVYLRFVSALSILIITATLTAQTGLPADCLLRYFPRCGPPRVVCVNLHVFQDNDGKGNWQNTPEGRTQLEQLIKWVNGYLRMENCSPTDPCPGVIYGMKDTQIRLAIRNIYFYRNSALRTSSDGATLQKAAFAAHPGAARQLNIYFTQPNPIPGAPPVTPPSTNMALDQLIIVMSSYDSDMPYRSATDLAANFARALGLLGTTSGWFPETCDKTSCDYLSDVFCGSKCPQDGGDPASSTRTATNNIMAGGCFFSDLQIARMHRTLSTLSPRKYLEPCGCVKPPDALALWLSFDDSGATTTNVFGAAAEKSGPLTEGPMMVGKSLCFDGRSAAIKVAHDAGLQFGSGPFTIDAWVRRRPPDDGVRVIVDKRVVGRSVNGFEFMLYNGRPGLQLGDGAYSNFFATPEVPADGAFHHVAVTVNRTSATGGVFYLDGAPLSPAFNPTVRSGSLNNTAPLYVGMESARTSFFSGCLDEVELFRRALSPAEVKEIADAAGTGKCRLFLPASPAASFCSTNSTVNAKHRICNNSTEDREFHYAFTPLPAGGNCTIAGPTGFTPQGGVIRVPAGHCFDLGVMIDRPAAMKAAGDRACYQVTLTEAPDTILYTSGVVEDRRNQCDVQTGDKNAPNLPLGIRQTSFCDASQRGADWSSKILMSRGGSPTPRFTIANPTTGGNPGEYRSVQLVTGTYLTISNSLGGDSFVPMTDGTIVEVDGAFDVRLASSLTPVQVSLLLEQDGQFFYGPRINVTTTTWKHEQQLALKVADFTTLPVGVGLPGNRPDFSCGAKPIRLGYATLLNAPGMNTIGIDNWCVTFRTRCCAAAAPAAVAAPPAQDVEPCCDEQVTVDAGGNIVLPDDADSNTPPIVEYIDQSNGPVNELYPQFDTSVDTWYPQVPCDGCIGGDVPEEAMKPDLQQALADIGLPGVSLDDINTTLQDVERVVDELTIGEKISFSELAPVSKPYAAPALPHKNEPVPSPVGPRPMVEGYVFGGRDIVFVHGLQVGEIVTKLNPNSSDYKAANATWVVEKDLARDASAKNPEYYDGGYFKNVANDVWRQHIEKLLRGKNKANRYLIVSYNCSERMEIGAQAVLRQIADAMNFGTGVIDPLNPGKVVTDFGTPSLVLVTHSTGGLITDVAYTAAANNPNLGVSYIPKYTKGRVAAHSAFGGSALATAAIAGSALANKLPPWVCQFTRLAIELAHPDVEVTQCPMTPNVVMNSILVDLVPLVAQRKWGASVHDSGIPTVVIGGAHPTFVWPFKYILHPGFDDGVVSVNSQFAIQNTMLMWPSGFRPRGLFGALKVFDAGLFGPLGGRTLLNVGVAKITSNTLNNPLRAISYYVDQAVNTAPAVAMALPPLLVASGPIPWTSASGMRQPVGSNYELHDDLVNPATGIAASFNPLRRAPKHYSYLFSTSDHSFGTTTPHDDRNYRNTPFGWQTGGEKNWEETRVITDGAIYQKYAMPYANDDAPLLRFEKTPVPEERVRGLRVRYLAFRRFRVVWREAWIWKRLYYVLPGSDNRVQFDYVYETVLQ